MSHVISRDGQRPTALGSVAGASSATSSSTTPLRSPWRWLASALLLVAAGSHVPLIQEHLVEAPYIGVLFILLAVVCTTLAAIVVIADTVPVWVAAGVVTALAITAFLLSRTVGLPGLGDDVGNWTEPLGFPALGSELLVAVLAVLVVRHRGSPVVGHQLDV